MKQILFLRHAKSSWSDLSLGDKERPLNKRGLADAPRIAGALLAKNLKPDKIICSPAKRTQMTMEFLVNVLGQPDFGIEINPNLYMSNRHAYLDLVQNADDQFDRLMIIGHNPVMTDLAEYFGGKEIDNVPTCGVLVINSSENSWMAVDDYNSTLIDFITPKNLV